MSTNCYVSNANETIYKRSEARAYAEVAVDEGYEWGGGCWNDNCSSDEVAARLRWPRESSLACISTVTSD